MTPAMMEGQVAPHGLEALERATVDPLHRFPAGFVGGTASAAIKKPGRQDMALIACPDGASAAAMFTKNLVSAAPLDISKRHLAMSRGHASAVLINSGCANAATGAEGLSRALECVDAVARELDVVTESILVNSTGVIGVQLPTDRMLAQMPSLVASLAPGRLLPVAQAIMTTDTYPKTAAIEVEHEGRRCLVCGMAKGAGMIHPDLSPTQATMISMLMTDADIEPPVLARLLQRSVDASFHRISIDGDTSTNDSVFALASGKAGAFPESKMAQAFRTVAKELALLIVRDGEGFERGIEVRVTGAKTTADALTVARTIAMSLLVRCAVTGGDPNWGRILAAAGRAGVHLRVEDLHLSVGGVDLFADGAPAPTPLAERERVFREPLVSIHLDLGQGSASDEFFSCGLTESYVRLNADYTT
ncbi:MAG: bifunctional glutamate N-acetyltransferase/amino-acid acetyltransferase ArgJ [Phycisphaerae bacterium]|nr:bifunctional glutamate N-acetyltransferase/amino-acid acetyltransferase ArgJ [Phycisphaerae bacterium]